jgi:hypothetical protein
LGQDLATAGRSKGIRLVLVTQRTQALHNALLGSCDTLIAHRLTAPADQAPVLNWLKSNTTPGVLEMVSAQLASLKTGAGWICSGEAKVFERVDFPRISTYDNTATPTGDDSKRGKSRPRPSTRTNCAPSSVTRSSRPRPTIRASSGRSSPSRKNSSKFYRPVEIQQPRINPTARF